MGGQYRGGAKQAQELWYQKQPLPLIGVFSAYSSDPGVYIYDSHLELVSAMGNSDRNYATPTNGELWSTMSGWMQTNGQVSSNSATTNWVKSTVAQQADGHCLISLSPNGGLAAKRADVLASVLRDFGTVIGPMGYRQDFSLFFNGQTIGQYVKCTPQAIDQLSISGTDKTTAHASVSYSCLGMASYNANIDTLVAITENTANTNQYRAHIWKNPNVKLTAKVGQLAKFIKEAKAGTGGASYQFIDFTWAGGADQESYKHLRVIQCHDNKIALVRFRPSSGVTFTVLDPNTGTGVRTLSNIGTTVGTTTSYGCEQGAPYGLRHQITWDNKWVVCYAPYYYYGCGMAAFVINVDDPLNYYLRFTDTNTSDGVGVLPIGESGFIFSPHYNNNDGGAGLYFAVQDFAVSGTGIQLKQTEAPVGKDTAITHSYSTGVLETGYTSTNYSCLMPVTSWFRGAQ